MMLGIILLRIVIACQLHNIRAFLGILPRHVVGADGDGRIPLGIMQPHLLHQLPGNDLTPLIGMRVINFIADTPHEQAGMVPVPSHPAFYVGGRPFPEEPPVVVRGFAPLPHIEGFGDHQKTHFISKLHQLRSRHIMGGPHRINAHFLQDPEPPPGGCFVENSPQRPKIMMLTGPVQLHPDTVQGEALLRVQLHKPESHRIGDGFNLLPALRLAQDSNQFVQMRLVRAPELRIPHTERLPVYCNPICGNGDTAILGCRLIPIQKCM
ncbi:hypothetical protein D3C75_686640 [compost metagenome]